MFTNVSKLTCKKYNQIYNNLLIAHRSISQLLLTEHSNPTCYMHNKINLLLISIYIQYKMVLKFGLEISEKKKIINNFRTLPIKPFFCWFEKYWIYVACFYIYFHYMYKVHIIVFQIILWFLWSSYKLCWYLYDVFLLVINILLLNSVIYH